jgi:EF-P beta-lysylation protein EpmB
MIPGTRPAGQPPAWQRELARSVTDPAELVRLLDLDPTLIEPARAAAARFALRVPRGYVARMKKADPRDPLLAQVLPLQRELASVPGFTADPVGDLASMVARGVLHKYEGRVLLTATGACAIHCRYCFRRHFPYGDANPAADHWSEAVRYVAGMTSVREVILSGGDPLTMSDARLADLVGRLAAHAHVERLRVHTRLPVVLPERITDELVYALSSTRLKPVVVLHANHANEIDAAVVEACERLAHARVTLLNQTVLLAGVNDDVNALCDLSEALFAAGVLPYYLHQLDRVEGAAHYEVPDDRAYRLHRAMQQRLPGYLVPRLVREQSGALSKISLG